MRTRLFLSTLLGIVIALPALAQTPPPANAADSYRKAMTWWEKNARGDERTLTDDEINALSDSFDGNWTDVQRSAYEKAKPYVELMREAGRTANSDFGLDYSQGFELLLPHLSSMRNATRLLRFDAQVQMIDGNADAALASLRAVNGISRHARGDGITISSLVSAAILSVDDGMIKEAIGRGALDADRAAELLKDFDQFAGNDPLNLAAAMGNEATMASATFEDLMREGGVDKLREVIGVDDEAAAAKLKDQTPESLRDDLAKYKSVMDRTGEAITNPDRAAGRDQLKALEASIAAGDEGLAAQFLAPSMLRVAEANWRVIDMIAAQRATLEELRDGKKSPASLANAAYAYLRLASLFDGMPEESQRELEAARVARSALDSDALEHVRNLIAPTREALQREFRLATECGRCEFRMQRAWSSRADVMLMPRYAGPLRGAMRVALTDALLGDSARGAHGRVRGSDVKPAKPAETIGWAIALAAHLSSDPLLGHSLAASTVLSEASEALDEATRRGLVSAEELASLRQLLARVEPSDPTKLRKAIAAERELIGVNFGTENPEIDGAAVRRALAQRDASSLAALLLVMQVGGVHPAPDFAQRWSAEALSMPLNGLGDLVAPPSIDAAREAGARIESQAVALVNKPLAQLALFVLPAPPCDFAACEARASAALVRLAELTRERTAPAAAQ